MQAVIPLPIPRLADAPSFDGSNLTDFLSILKQHGHRAGLTDDELAPYILQYCTEDVKRVVRYLPELGPTATSWAEAEEELKGLYGSEDRPTRFSIDDLRSFCAETHAKQAFETKNDVEVYLRRFMEISGSIRQDGRLTDSETNLYFVTGLPFKTMGDVIAKVPAANRTTSNPPAIKEVRRILMSLFKEDSLQNFARQLYMDYDTQTPLPPVSSTKPAQRAVRFDPVPSTVPAARSEMNIEDLAARMDQLTIHQAEMRSLLEKRSQQLSRPTTPEGQKRCFVCGLTGVHSIGWRHCPTAKELFNENLVMGDPNGRLVARDGSELPLTRDPGGIAAILRARTHGSTAYLTAQFDGRNALGANTSFVSDHGWYADPALRSGRDSSRPEPYAGPPAKQKSSASKLPAQTPNPPQAPLPGCGVPLNEFRLDPRREDPPHPIVQPPPVPATLPPMHPLNTEDGWREREKQRKGDKGKHKEDSEMPDAARKQWRFLSQIQDNVSVDEVFTELMNAPVPAGLTIGKVIGVSPPLQKKVTDYTQRRREYVTSTGEYEILSPEVAKSAASGFIPTGITRTNDSIFEDVDDGEAVADFYSSFHALPSYPSRFLAFATGMITVSIKGQEVRCLVDTGSELNLVSHSLVQSLGLPNDTEGTRWSLSGVNGGSDRLMGLCRDVPMRVGGHNFNHHLFVSRQSPGKQDIILGQPWIQWFSGRIDLDRDGSMDLCLWEDGDRSHPATISVRLLKPGNERNQTGFQQGSHRVVYAEEASDDDADFH
ncbi:hypothetical protein C8R45DRAFT_834620 [Mycena sanguinolenta]|nr:hypothetical protein C8R45DRAFT_834620 [Mycena sanguinolenta]